MASPRRGPFAALLASCVISVAGTAMSAIAVPWLVLTTTGSAAKTGVVAFAQMGLYVVAQFLAGPVVDRVGLRRSFVVGNTLAAASVGAIPLLHAAGRLDFATLVGLAGVAGAVRGGADCANTALVPATAQVGDIALERAAGLNSSANRAAQLVGAPLAGVLVTLAGPLTAIAVDAGTFAVAAALVAIWVRVPEQRDAAAAKAGPATGSEPASAGVGAATGSEPASAKAGPTTESEAELASFEARPATESESELSFLQRYGRDLAEGMRFVRGDRLLLGIITMVAMTNLLDQGWAEVIVPVWVRQEFGSPSALAVVGTVGAAAGLAGNFAGAWLGPRLPRRALYSVGFLVGGAPRFVILAAASTLPPVIGVLLVSEVFAGSLNSVIGATAYERIPEHLRARVLGVVRASAWIGIPFGALLAGYVVEGFGVRSATLAFGLVYLVTTLAPFVFPAWRQMRRPVRVPETTAVSAPI